MRRDGREDPTQRPRGSGRGGVARARVRRGCADEPPSAHRGRRRTHSAPRSPRAKPPLRPSLLPPAGPAPPSGILPTIFRLGQGFSRNSGGCELIGAADPYDPRTLVNCEIIGGERHASCWEETKGRYRARIFKPCPFFHLVESSYIDNPRILIPIFESNTADWSYSGGGFACHHRFATLAFRSS